jgi:hypothetical protein
VQIDSRLVFARIESLVHEHRTVGAKMNEVIDACEAAFPNRGWRDLRELPYDSEVAHLRSWIPDVLRNEPPPFAIRGVWFGVGNYVYDGRETADVHVIGSAAYDASDNDQSWAVYAEYRPERREAGSEILDSIYNIAYRVHPKLENNAEWPLCLAYPSFALAEVLRSETPALFSGDAEIGVVVGFDEGDSITIGRLTSRGLLPAA